MTAPEPNIVLARIATLQRTILNPVSGSPVYAYDNVPYTISTADIPAFVTFVGAMPTPPRLMGSDAGAREFEETRQYQMLLFLAPYMTGVEGEQYGLATPYFAPVYTLFQGNPHLQSLDGVVSSGIQGDTGMVTLPFAGQSYYGIRFTLQVVGRVRRLLAAGE